MVYSPLVFILLFLVLIVGVVGITGDREQVQRYGNIVRRMTEIMVTDSLSKDTKKYDRRMKYRFMEEWISKPQNSFSPAFIERGLHLGIDVRKMTFIMVLCASVLAAGSVALAGAIGFCGLVVPHCVRRLCSASHRINVLPMFLWGGIFLMVCDILSRMILPGQELPIGVVTSLTGGPVFLWLLNRKGSRQ